MARKTKSSLSFSEPEKSGVIRVERRRSRSHVVFGIPGASRLVIGLDGLDAESKRSE